MGGQEEMWEISEVRVRERLGPGSVILTSKNEEGRLNVQSGDGVQVTTHFKPFGMPKA